jgi:hypothetical protein
MMANFSDNKKMKFLTNKEGYAVVYNNSLFILTPDGVSQAYPKDEFIHFKAKYNKDFSTGYGTSSLLMFGLVGGLIYSSTYTSDDRPITFKIDHLTGAWLPVSER